MSKVICFKFLLSKSSLSVWYNPKSHGWNPHIEYLNASQSRFSLLYSVDAPTDESLVLTVSRLTFNGMCTSYLKPQSKNDGYYTITGVVADVLPPTWWNIFFNLLSFKLNQNFINASLMSTLFAAFDDTVKNHLSDSHLSEWTWLVTFEQLWELNRLKPHFTEYLPWLILCCPFSHWSTGHWVHLQPESGEFISSFSFCCLSCGLHCECRFSFCWK